jgi:hypothetical protein
MLRCPLRVDATIEHASGGFWSTPSSRWESVGSDPRAHTRGGLVIPKFTKRVSGEKIIQLTD